MAYSRYSNNCEWYIFWQHRADTSRRGDELLAVWHIQRREAGPSYTLVEINAMLATGDFSHVPDYTSSAAEFLERVFREFVADVNSEYEHRDVKLR